MKIYILFFILVNSAITFVDAQTSIVDCILSPGFRYNYQTQECEDIDECAQKLHNCENLFECSNSHGSYVCKCRKGFKKSFEETCIDIDECSFPNTNECDEHSQKCINTEGNYRCDCKDGYFRDIITQDCRSRKESMCDLHPNLCKSNQKCVNSNSSAMFQCENVPLGNISCPKGKRFNSDGECEDIDECAEFIHECDDYQVCENVDGKYNCNCMAGFVKSPAGFCTDIDECQTKETDYFFSQPKSSAKCTANETCINLEGSYRCKCKIGFERNNAGPGCLDIDECKIDQYDCKEPFKRCINKPGAYTCVCMEGFDGDTCEDIDECKSNNSVCKNGICINTEGSFKCHCNANFENPKNAPTICQDIDECKENDGRGPCDHICDNFDGGYSCSCRKGFVLQNDKRTCKDIDECKLDIGKKCDHRCENSPGNFTCVCNIGYRLDNTGFICTDIDECTEGTHPCKHPKICLNIKGGHKCICPSGYRTIDDKCEDIDECRQRHVCGARSLCINTEGSYKCKCENGYKLVEDTCENIDECLENDGLGPCEYSCLDTPGSYKCECGEGYEIDADKKRCKDIDECKNSRCEWRCENFPGSYTCSCPKGFELTSDRFCVDINECRNYDWTCPDNEICFNTYGGAYCEKLKCDDGYIMINNNANTHIGQMCILNQNECHYNDEDCKKHPSSIDFAMIALKSHNSTTTKSRKKEKIYEFKLIWHNHTIIADYQLDLIDTSNSIGGVIPAVREDFRVEMRPKYVNLYLEKPISGPQNIKLSLKITEKDGGQKRLSEIQLFIHVSEYNFKSRFP